MASVTDAVVRKSITVNATVEHAFDVFTAGYDSWWPREHHIGTAPLTEAVIEGRAGGRCYSKQADGTECDWGQILTWDPPHRFVLAWQINPEWKYEPDLAKSSEVEVRFSPEPDGGTRVDLDGFHGLNQVGDLGLRDQVDRHYAQIFGVSLAIGASDTPKICA